MYDPIKIITTFFAVITLACFLFLGDSSSVYGIIEAEGLKDIVQPIWEGIKDGRN